jgi:hypothetical protein
MSPDPVAVSVIVPHRDQAALLGPLVERLRALDQEHGLRAEVVIVDDASRAPLPRLPDSGRVRLIRLPRPRGPGAARNQGAAAARGEVLAFLDADCLPGRGWAQGLAAFAGSREPGAAAAQYDEDRAGSFIARFALEELLWRERRLRPGQALAAASSCNLVCRREDFVRAGGFLDDPRLPPAEDLEFTARLAAAAPLLWRPDMAVGHSFRSSWGGYLLQQFRYARGGVYLALTCGPPRSGASCLQDRSDFQRGLLGAAMVLLLAAFLLRVRPEAAAAALLFSAAPHAAFLSALRVRRGPAFALAAWPAAALRDAAWLGGAAAGLLRAGLRRLGL